MDFHDVLIPTILVVNFLIYSFDKNARLWFVPTALICYSFTILFMYICLRKKFALPKQNE